MDGSVPISSQASRVLELPPSCIQSCRKYDKYFVVGTYNLQKDEMQPEKDRGDDDNSTAKTPQSRNGTLQVFRLDGTDPVLIQTVQQSSAILDLRFHPASEKQDILAVVSSTGTLAIFRLDPNKDLVSPLEHLATSRCDDLGEDVLFLQCNWHPMVEDLIGITTSSGEARLLRLDADYHIADPAFNLGIPNLLEAWSIAFSPPTAVSSREKSQVSVYCGGDDSMLRYSTCDWDSADQDSPYKAPHFPIIIKNAHTAGVTAILPLEQLTKSGGRIVVTGSYDDHLRLLIVHDLHETHGLKRVETVLEENLGGGVWRLDHIFTHVMDLITTVRLLASCMHAGARLLDLSSADGGETWNCRVLARFEEHKSMNYGSTLVYPIGDPRRLQFASTSFYDKLLCVWEYKE